jgi:hypothetical protein
VPFEPEIRHGPVPIRHQRERGAHAGDLAERRPHLVDDVGAVGAEPATAGVGARPPLRHFARRIGEHGHVHDERCDARVADQTLADGPRQQRLAGRVAKLGAEQMHDVSLLRRLEHAPCLGGVARKGLLAQHVLARCDRLQREVGVGVRGGGDRHGVDARQGNRLGEGGEAMGHLEHRCALPRLLRVAADQRMYLDTRFAKGPEMSQHPEARSHDDRSDLLPLHGVTVPFRSRSPAPPPRSPRP